MSEVPKFNPVAPRISPSRLRPLTLDVMETARGLQGLRSVSAPTQLIVLFERGAEPQDLAAATEFAARAYAESVPSGRYGNLHSVTELTPAGVADLRRRLQDEGVANDVSRILGLVDISTPDKPKVGAIDLERGEITTVSFTETSKFD